MEKLNYLIRNRTDPEKGIKLKGKNKIGKGNLMI
jgi:hypothetical protein